MEGGSVAKKKKRSPTSKTEKAGLTIAVTRVEKVLRKGRVSKSVSRDSVIYLTGVVERVLEEILKECS